MPRKNARSTEEPGTAARCLDGISLRPDGRFAAWAKDVGVACGPLAPDEKDDMIHELDAVVAHLYGLTEQHLVHLYQTFHEGWDYETRLKASLKHCQKWRTRFGQQGKL